MNEGDLLSQLAPVRIPAEFAAFGLRDALLLMALGILTGVLLSPLLRLLTRPRPSRLSLARTAISRFRQVPDEARVVALANLLRKLDPSAPLPDGIHDGLYDPRNTMDAELLEQAVLAAARKRARA
ncbi:hypothetical protein [Puniceibacterium sediminis]|uniref:Uncharacterized protein n=1 Tax=Puniceibacterium sediminis TaxID=1608407 RepID=A0A238YZ92_9RHOB|nr:hypothetical protein [Puniceibacterium sediminis]SNR75953.1 hypothetical protein SAMN06265370_12135 [Puniceibacterium sediminis]